LTPSYDSNTRTLTIPIATANADTTGTSFIDVGTSTGNGIIEPTEAGDYIIEYILDYNDGSISYRPITWTVSPPGFSTITATRLSIDVSKKTAYRFNFTPSVDILAGTPGVDITKKYGKLILTFETENGTGDNIWPVDLGTGLT
jgi:hypothetical protein